MSGGDEEGVEGWSGTVNQSNTSQPSDFNRGFVEATMDRDFNDSQPIYRQLRDRVVAMILDGVLNEGDPLPSVRNVAAEYRVNPLTVLKGYQQLVDEQLVEKKRGRGMFINSRRARPAAPGRAAEVPRRGLAEDPRHDPAPGPRAGGAAERRVRRAGGALSHVCTHH